MFNGAFTRRFKLLKRSNKNLGTSPISSVSISYGGGVSQSKYAQRKDEAYMFVGIKAVGASVLLAMLCILCTGSGVIAADGAWHVSKSSGDVWVTNLGVQLALVTSETILKPGDNIRTGQTGRVLLVRGEETMLISPNSSIGIPNKNKDGMLTTIIQQAGSILLEVEKRNVKHFEVETPHLAAVVKGTQFRISVDKDNSHVDVLRGQVEVAAFKSGQYALVQAGQTAKVPAQGLTSLSLSGSGTLNPIQQGTPRRSSVEAILVPDMGFSAPDRAPEAQQSHSAPLQGEGVSVLASSGDVSSVGASLPIDATTEDTWTSRLVAAGRGMGSANARWFRNDDLMLALSFPVGVGIFVAGVVAGKRRWQRRRLR
jgi:hypothetical protein